MNTLILVARRQKVMPCSVSRVWHSLDPGMETSALTNRGVTLMEAGMTQALQVSPVCTFYRMDPGFKFSLTHVQRGGQTSPVMVSGPSSPETINSPMDDVGSYTEETVEVRRCVKCILSASC